MRGENLQNFDELLRYGWRRNNWMLDISRFWRDYSEVRIEKPVFLLGTQGGGLTLISRMLRRNPAVISVTGDHHYWAGADEMQNVLGPILSPRLTGIKHKAPPDEVFDTPRGWLYATDRLIEKYRSTAGQAGEREKQQLQHLLRWLAARHGKQAQGAVRFVDKSQLYTIKVGYINALLEGLEPKFVLITRNPYAVCFRSVEKARSLSRLADRFSFQQRLQFAAQHWGNSMKYALQDRDQVSHFLILKLEDLLARPNHSLKNLCSFLELDYRPEMLPQEGDQFPPGTLRKSRWYPLREDVNQRYLEVMDQKSVEIIAGECRETADQLGYAPPQP